MINVSRSFFGSIQNNDEYPIEPPQNLTAAPPTNFLGGPFSADREIMRLVIRQAAANIKCCFHSLLFGEEFVFCDNSAFIR
ncbi:hypothetical protein [Anaerohalosphaera lusitana]|uniref:hypothetical protein n=1 Tax=Anaerohalosphaera lusitana TaxID=1936003 RepID=UPI0011BA67C4|nr:hypothetical protein [Anaerohalosphaera lusitana]